MKSLLPSFFFTLGFPAWFLVFSGCAPERAEEPSVQIRPAKLVTIEPASAERTLTFPAVIEARSTARLTFPVGGTLEEIMVRGGDEVTQGTVIARLDPRTFRNQVSTAQTQFNEAVADYTRADRLLAENAIARNVYEQRRAALEVARANLDNANKALEDSVLRSPFDGVIAERHLDENQNVGAGEPIVTVQTTGMADAVVNIPSTLVANANFIEPIESVVMLDARPNLRIPTTFDEATTTADAATQTFAVRFVFNPPEDLRVLPGMTGTVLSRIAITAEEYVAQVVAPIGAVVSDGATEYVWRVDPETMAVARQDITTGRRVGETVIVTTGVTAGDVIVGAGASYLHEGMQVRPYQP